MVNGVHRNEEMEYMGYRWFEWLLVVVEGHELWVVWMVRVGLCMERLLDMGYK